MIGNRIASFIRFLREDLWEEDLRCVDNGWRRLGLGILRVAAHVIERFTTSLGTIQAAGLTLLTMLALVPLLSLVFAVAKAMGYGEKLNEQLDELSLTLPEEMQGATDSVQDLVNGVSFSTLGVVGTLLVVWTALMLFTKIEQTFNHVWRTTHRRSWVRRVSDFIALVVLVPPLAAGALVLSSLLRGAALIADLREVAPWLAWLYEAGLGIVPHVMLWIALTMLYKTMPSARVRWRPAAVGGICAGSASILLYGFYLKFQVGIAQANAIYGTLAALPMLLIYLQLAWTLIGAGAEVSYAVQNLQALRSAKHRIPVATPAVLRRLGWLVVSSSTKAFRSGQGGIRLEELATELNVPEEWIDQVTDRLIAAGLLVSVQDNSVVMPARPPEQIEWRQVVAVMDGTEGGEPQAGVKLPSEAAERFEEAYAAARAALAGHTF